MAAKWLAAQPVAKSRNSTAGRTFRVTPAELLAEFLLFPHLGPHPEVGAVGGEYFCRQSRVFDSPRDE